MSLKPLARKPPVEPPQPLASKSNAEAPRAPLLSPPPTFDAQSVVGSAKAGDDAVKEHVERLSALRAAGIAIVFEPQVWSAWVQGAELFVRHSAAGH